jgi:hypothetical protein
MKMRKSLALMTMVTVAALIITPVFADPKFTKMMAPLDECGKVIYNTNPEDHELEVEVEECVELALLVPELEEYITAGVHLNGEYIGDVMVDAEGNGKVTMILEDPGLTIDFEIEPWCTDVIEVVYDTVVLTSGVWGYFKGPIP